MEKRQRTVEVGKENPGISQGGVASSSGGIWGTQANEIRSQREGGTLDKCQGKGGILNIFRAR